VNRGKKLCALSVATLAVSLVQAGAPTLTLTSPDFRADSPISEVHVFNSDGCTGQDRSPALSWQGAPAGTKSYVITMFDLDERGSPSGWWHWVLYNIPATTAGLPENAGAEKDGKLPAGATRGKTDYGTTAYDGPCPGKGEPPHRYLITLYALRVEKLSLPAESSGAMVTITARDFTLAKASVTARYGR
jgi:Raf kinase inhibitor-like YbhB/YbcL family protein